MAPHTGSAAGQGPGLSQNDVCGWGGWLPGFRWPAGLPRGSLHATAASSTAHTPLQRPPSGHPAALSRLTTLASSAGTQPVTCVPASVLRAGQGFEEVPRADRLASAAGNTSLSAARASPDSGACAARLRRRCPAGSQVGERQLGPAGGDGAAYVRAAVQLELPEGGKGSPGCRQRARHLSAASQHAAGGRVAASGHAAVRHTRSSGACADQCLERRWRRRRRRHRRWRPAGVAREGGPSRPALTAPGGWGRLQVCPTLRAAGRRRPACCPRGTCRARLAGTEMFVVRRCGRESPAHLRCPRIQCPACTAVLPPPCCHRTHSLRSFRKPPPVPHAGGRLPAAGARGQLR